MNPKHKKTMWKHIIITCSKLMAKRKILKAAWGKNRYVTYRGTREKEKEMFVDENNIINQKNLCSPMFILPLFTTAKCWDQPKCPSVKWVDQKTVVHLHSGILCSWKKEGAPTLHNCTDGTREHYVKWNKAGSERQIPYDLTYKWNLINKTNKWGK